MKHYIRTSMLLVALFFSACGNDQTSSAVSTSETNNSESDQPDNIFKVMSDKVKELDQEEGLSVLLKHAKKEDGTTVYDDIIKEIQIEDAESGGQVSEMINLILNTAEKEIGLDVTKTMEEALENANRIPKEFGGEMNEILKTIEVNGHTETIENVLEGLNDFITTGSEQGGFEIILREVVDMTVKEDPSFADSDFVKEAEEILNNDILSGEKEAERLLNKILEKNKHLIEQASQRKGS